VNFHRSCGWVNDVKIMKEGAGRSVEKKAYVTGRATGSSTHPIDLVPNPGNEYYQSSFGGGTWDAYICRLNIENTYALEYSTYWGGNGDESGVAITGKDFRNLYFAGYTTSHNLTAAELPDPGGSAYYSSTLNGYSDGFILRFDPTNQNDFVWGTLYGGNQNDAILDLCLDIDNTVYATGETRSTNNFVQTTHANYYDQSVLGNNNTSTKIDAFILAFNSSNADIHSTYFGGINPDCGAGIASDGTDYLYLTGTAVSDQATFPLVEFSTISPLDWYDGNFTNNSSAGVGIIYVVGRAVGSDYPNIPTGAGGTASTNYAKNGTKQNGVVTRFGNTGNIKWSSYIGSSEWTEIQGICIKNDIVYFTGTTNKNDIQFYNSGQYYYSNYNGSYDAFFAVYNNLNQRTHLSYLGGFGIDEGWDIKIDQYNDIYIAGKSTSSSFPSPAGGNPINTYDHGLEGMQDYFVSCIKQGFTDLLWSTLVGGTNTESWGYGFGVSIDINGLDQLHLTGQTLSSTNFPLNNAGGVPAFFQGTLNGGSDGTITRFDLNPVQIVGIAENALSNNGVVVYPNPTSSYIIVKTNSIKNKMFSIYNTLGQIIIQQNSDSDFVTLDLKSLTSGVYILVVDDKLEPKTFKLIKN